MDDPEGRPTVADLIAERRNERLFHVGRLDTDTEGLLILTNDGDFAHRLAHPSFQVPKTYIAEVAGVVGAADSQRLRRGITLEDGPVSLPQSRSFPPLVRRPLSRSQFRKAGIASCAVRWKRLAIRSAGCRGSESDRSGSGT